ncbi:siderophore ABC transporter substrate-binding protein [Pseudogracilibacillus sp. SE30717A]|uniref:siderophore ABC transporter substrate-binding protein n=1 Tax=Pseudogracilibacillus sp. SE30717A TaxID=3098293 RepID=UPI00300E136E
MKKLLYGLLIAALAVLVVGCGSSNKESDAEKTEDTPEEAAADTVTVEHELGTTEVAKNPEKIVVFDFGVLDTLDKLGIEVVGVPQSGVIPTYLEKYAGEEYENIGSLKEPDFEKIAEIDPDLIIISGRQADLYDQLQELGDTIYLGVDTTRYMESFEENVRTVGEIFGKEDDVETALSDIEASIATLKEKAETADQNALIVLANDDKISAYGTNSRFGIIHDVFGVPPVDENIEVSTHGMNVSFEYVAEKDPDLLYVVDRSAAVGEESSAEQLVENKLMEKTKAYQNDNIIYLDPEYWYLSGGGLESVAGMLEEIDASIE